MKKWVILPLFMNLFSYCMAQEPLTASVTKTWSVDTARQEAFANLQPWVNTGNMLAVDPNLIEHREAILNHKSIYKDKAITAFSNGVYSVSKLCARDSYMYDLSGKLGAFSFSSSPHYSSSDCEVVYPNKSYKYIYPSGKVLTIDISVNPSESFTFWADGSLNSHWIGSNCYNADGSSCGTRRSFQN